MRCYARTPLRELTALAQTSRLDLGRGKEGEREVNGKREGRGGREKRK